MLTTKVIKGKRTKSEHEHTIVMHYQIGVYVCGVNNMYFMFPVVLVKILSFVVLATECFL